MADSRSSGGAGTVYASVFLILDASFVIGSAGPFIQSFSQAASAGSRILGLIDYPDIPIDVYAREGQQADENTFGPDKEIQFKQVSFAYPARPTETILDSVDFTIKTGSTVGIVGASGSGKSTIAALLLRLYDPSQGAIEIDGIQLPDFNLASLRDQIALVDQDPAVFSGTILSNIKDGYGRPELTEDEIVGKCIEAAKAADAWSFIESLPNGMDTWLGEPNGTKLSGGQKQRLCLARALVGHPALLVLDEATSALDTISEASILAELGLSRSMGHRTTIMIAHRLASVGTADKIIVMGKGKILEEGDHGALMARQDGVYRQLIEAQRITSDNASDFSISEKSERKEEACQEDLIIEANTSIKTDDQELKKQYSTMTITKRCLALSQSRVLLTCLALLGSLITGGLILGEAVIFGHLVTLLNGSAPSGQVSLFSLMFLVIACAAFVGYITSGSCFGIVSEHLVMRTRDTSLRTILRQDMEWFLQPGRSTSTLISVISIRVSSKQASQLSASNESFADLQI